MLILMTMVVAGFQPLLCLFCTKTGGLFVIRRLIFKDLGFLKAQNQISDITRGQSLNNLFYLHWWAKYHFSILLGLHFLSKNRMDTYVLRLLTCRWFILPLLSSKIQRVKDTKVFTFYTRSGFCWFFALRVCEV